MIASRPAGPVHRPPAARRRRRAVAVAVAVLVAGGGALSPAEASAAVARVAPTAVVQVALNARTIAAAPGFRRTAHGTRLAVMRFTTVATLSLPATGARHSVVLGTAIRVAVPIRMALSVRAWCDASPAGRASPGGGSADDVLVIGQNPLPGRSAQQVASRVLSGRAVVDLPAGRAARCTLQVSPRTVSTSRSTLRLLSGRFSATPVDVVARAAQRPALLVGPTAPRLGQASVRDVARLGPVAATGAVRAEGEAELTTCAIGYHLCPSGTRASSVVEVSLVLTDVDAAGRPCRTWLGTARRVTITAALHHVKVVAPAAAPRTRCGRSIEGAVRVRYRSGAAVEVEPTLGTPGDAVRVQTHLWLSHP